MDLLASRTSSSEGFCQVRFLSDSVHRWWSSLARKQRPREIQYRWEEEGLLGVWRNWNKKIYKSPPKGVIPPLQKYALTGVDNIESPYFAADMEFYRLPTWSSFFLRTKLEQERTHKSFLEEISPVKMCGVRSRKIFKLTVMTNLWYKIVDEQKWNSLQNETIPPFETLHCEQCL